MIIMVNQNKQKNNTSEGLAWWEKYFYYWPQPLIIGFTLLTISFVPRSFSQSTSFSDLSSLGYSAANLSTLDGKLRIASRTLAITGAIIAAPPLIFFVQRLIRTKWGNKPGSELPLKWFERAKNTLDYLWWFFLAMIIAGTYLTLNDNFTKPGTYTALIGTAGQSIGDKLKEKIDCENQKRLKVTDESKAEKFDKKLKDKEVNLENEKVVEKSEDDIQQYGIQITQIEQTSSK